ncbi:MAG: hypothetical protein NTW04_00690 [Elusimicrobia bacterium]|nr:hypothetical protein [Elusimicrobiota bacterium]
MSFRQIALEVSLTRPKIVALLTAVFISLLPLALGSEAITLNTYYPVAQGMGYQRLYVGDTLKIGADATPNMTISKSNIVLGGSAVYTNVNSISSVGSAFIPSVSGGGKIIFDAGKGIQFPPDNPPSYQGAIRFACHWKVGLCPSGFMQLAKSSSTGSGMVIYNMGYSDNQTLCCKASYFVES